jgi:hypothetical protein
MGERPVHRYKDRPALALAECAVVLCGALCHAGMAKGQ